MSGLTWKLTAAAAALVCVASVVTAGALRFATPPVPPVEPSLVPVAAPAPVPEKKHAAGVRVADARQRARSQNNLKQILIAIHNYHDANGHFPQNVTDKNGKPLLSWRVQILPYIEQDQLYKQFNLDEPWDSENNKKLLALMPDMYRVGFEPKDETKTYYQGFAGPGTMFDPTKKVKFTDITDGLSNTLAVVEAGPPVEWTKPADIPYAPKAALPKLDGPFSNTLIAAGADGATYTLRRDIGEKELHRLIQMSDGEIVSIDDFRMKFPLTPEEVKAVQGMLKDNEKLVAEIAEQFQKQQKMIADAVKRPGGKPAVDAEMLARMHEHLKSILGDLKLQTEELKRYLDDTPPEPPAKKGPPK